MVEKRAVKTGSVSGLDTSFSFSRFDPTSFIQSHPDGHLFDMYTAWANHGEHTGDAFLLPHQDHYNPLNHIPGNCHRFVYRVDLSVPLADIKLNDSEMFGHAPELAEQTIQDLYYSIMTREPVYMSVHIRVGNYVQNCERIYLPSVDDKDAVRSIDIGHSFPDEIHLVEPRPIQW